MPKVSTYLSGKVAEDFERYVEAQREETRNPGRVTASSAACYLIRKGLETIVRSERATRGAVRGEPRRGETP